MASEHDPWSNWKEEKQSAFLYREMSRVEAGSRREKLFARLAEEAEKQAKLWEEKMKDRGNPPPFTPARRARVVSLLLRALGPRAIRPTLAAMKVRGLSVYDGHHNHHRMDGGLEKRHSASHKGGNLRAAVFGANDGLISNASLILGMAGAAPDNPLVAMSGVAGLLGGALSMAAGEYISVKSQRELFEYQIALEREELDEYPEEEARELALIYEHKGIAAEEALRLARQIISDPEKALDTLAREELGLNPDDLGSPGAAALFSFVAFAVGASIPLVPLLLNGAASLWATLIATGVSLFLLGCATSLFTGRNALVGGLRMLSIGGLAGTATFWLGKFLGAVV